MSTKAGCRKIPPNVPFMPIDGVSFHFKKGAYKWKYVVRRCIVDESNIFNQYQSYLVILDLICNARLIRTVSKVGPFYPRLIRKLAVNLPSDFNDPSAEEFHKVHIRGGCFNVSPELLNQFLGSHYQMTMLFSIPLSSAWLNKLLGKRCLSGQLIDNFLLRP